MRLFQCAVLLPVLVACQPDVSPQPNNPPAPASQVAVSQTVFAGTDVRKDELGGDFTLTDGTGKPFQFSSLKGKTVILAFGFTHCPDVCPTELVVFSEAVKQLGDLGKQVAVVFVSVDPERDTPDLIGRYVRQFHPEFIGLTATDSQSIDSVKKQYRIISAKTEVKSATAYNVDHTSGAYIVDKNGKTVLFEPYGLTATQIADDLRAVLKGL